MAFKCVAESTVNRDTGSVKIGNCECDIFTMCFCQAAVAPLAASETKSLLVVDWIEKLTVLSEVKAEWDCMQTGQRGREPGSPFYLPLSLSRFHCKIRNWIEKRKQTEWRVCEKYGTCQLCLEGSTDMYVQFISKLYRKHCSMLVGLLRGHINLQYMLHKMRRAKTPSYRRCNAEKETSVHILCGWPALEN